MSMTFLREGLRILIVPNAGKGRRHHLSLWQRLRNVQTNNNDFTYQRRRNYLTSSSSSRLLPRLTSVERRDDGAAIALADAGTRGRFSTPLAAAAPSPSVSLIRRASGIPHASAVSIEEPATPLPDAGKKLVKDDTWRLLRLVEPEKVAMSAAVGLLAVSSAVTMSVPFIMGKIIDIINSQVRTGTGLETLLPISQVLSLAE